MGAAPDAKPAKARKTAAPRKSKVKAEVLLPDEAGLDSPISREAMTLKAEPLDNSEDQAMPTSTDTGAAQVLSSKESYMQPSLAHSAALQPTSAPSAVGNSTAAISKPDTFQAEMPAQQHVPAFPTVAGLALPLQPQTAAFEDEDDYDAE